MDIFGLGEGFSNETFNNLALNKIRAEKDAKLDQLFNMGSSLKISDYIEAANLLLSKPIQRLRMDPSQNQFSSQKLIFPLHSWIFLKTPSST